MSTGVAGCEVQPARWTYDLATLEGLGVHLAPEQRRCLEPGCDADVLVVLAAPDATVDWDGYRSFAELPPLLRMSTDGRLDTTPIPMLGQVVWSLDCLGDSAGWHEAGWDTFPSVPVRLVVPRRYDAYDTVERVVRIWDVWGLDDVDQETAFSFADASEAAYAKFCPTKPAFDWVPPVDPVDFWDGDAWTIWTRLVASSRANAARALDAVPAWERRALAASERRFSPWVLS